MTEKNWKRTERRVAELLGGRRVPINGRGQRSDVEHSMFSVEVKHIAERWKWLDDAMEQAVAASKVEGDKIPLVVIHYAGTQASASAYIVMRMPAFHELLTREVPTYAVADERTAIGIE